MASDSVVNALLALAAGDRDGAVRLVAEAAAGPDPGLVAPALARHLAGGHGDVYADGSAFERFADGGGNVGLYRAAHAALAEAHGRARPRTVLDLGCGDGRLAVAAVRPGLGRIDLVEPSADLLGGAVARLTGAAATGAGGAGGAGGDGGAEVVAHPATAQAFLASTDARWDAAQSTFALHALGPADRADVLRTLASRAGRLLVVEFDVPAFADRSPEHASYAAERYEVGVAEYRDDEAVVAGFLMPVLAGQFDPARPRHTWEQPSAAWVADLEAAGFADVRRRRVAGYWWAPAELIEAVPSAPRHKI